MQKRRNSISNTSVELHLFCIKPSNCNGICINFRLQDLQSKLEEAVRSRDQLERVTFQVVDEMRQLKARTDTQSIEFSQVVGDLRNKSRRLEEENRQTVSMF